MKPKDLILITIDNALWGVGMGLFLSLFLAKHCPISGGTDYWIMWWGFGFIVLGQVVNAIRDRYMRKK
jgi:hypothetical protein